MHRPDFIKEENYLKWPEDEQRRYNFRVQQFILSEITRMGTITCGINTVASFVGGMVGGALAVVAQAKFKLFGG